MSEIEASGELVCVSEVGVEGDVSDSDIILTLKKCSLGTHQTVSEAYREKAKDCVIVGRVVEVKSGSYLSAVQKLIVREITPEGSSGSIFALFVLGIVAKHLKQFSIKVNDWLIILQSEISKSCLINFLHLQSHPYQLQIIVNCPPVDKDAPAPGIAIQLIRSKDPDVVKQKSREPGVNESPLHKNEDNTKPKTAEEECTLIPGGKKRRLMGEKYMRLQAPLELKKIIPRRYYKRLTEITIKNTCVNIMGIIVDVENGCKCSEKKEHILIYLQDESSRGKKFMLNLLSCKSDIPPLHKLYIMRALNVMIQSENNEAVGWVKAGELLATIDSDCEKPVTLLTVQENCTLPEEEEERILELRKFVKTSLSLGVIEIPSRESSVTPVPEKNLQAVTTNILPDIKEEESLKLCLDLTTENQQSESNSISSEVPANIRKKPEMQACPGGEEIDRSKSPSLPTPDIGSVENEMQAMWNFIIEC
ncbi:uncharacterized protein [Hetaerina americana]|uniref:uncharacterized protein isoform X2 n=1 Tax=Hetaerina americana TaxID=62018 RepID=UPI003A7F266A